MMLPRVRTRVSDLRPHACPVGVPRRIFPLGGLLLLLTLLPVRLLAQTIDDGIMMAKRDLFTGDFYTYETWDQYWEGTLKRENGNIGALTTQTNSWYANYGVTDRLNVIALVPYVWTEASQGVLHGMQGFQDITVAGKFSMMEKPSTKAGLLRAIAVLSAGIPLTDYTPDFAPLSIGTGSKRAAGRFTFHVQSIPGWYVTGSTAYTWRATVTLDRPFYYTDGQLFMTNEVDMPNVFDYAVSGGYTRRGLMTRVTYSQQRTLGGADIRRQDMPFVSNRMNFSKVGAMVMAPLPKVRSLAAQFAFDYTADGRNVGQATAITGGLFYTFGFAGRSGQ